MSNCQSPLTLLKHIYHDRDYLWNLHLRRVRIEQPPTFIVGCGHSGTSILLAILGMHSRIFPVPFESNIFLDHSSMAPVEKLQQFDKMAIAAGKFRWVEKTPRHIFHLRDIFELIPKAKVIIIIRDGRDVAASIQKRTGSIAQGAVRWVSDNEAGRPYWSHPNVHVMKYEELIIHFKPTMHTLLDFLGETYEEAIERHHSIAKKWYSQQTNRPESSAGASHDQYRNWQINQPLFDGRGKWRELPSKDQATLHEIAGDLLLELGYVQRFTV